jgi:hypothetical protein
MAGNNDLGCMEKRDLLNRSAISVETLLRWGQHYEDAEMVHDAVSFYEKAGAREPLRRILELARDEGDLFLFNRICRTLQHTPTRDEWLALAAKADELGKVSFAEQARRRVEEVTSKS